MVLGPATSTRVMVLGFEGSGGVEDAGAVGNGAVEVRAGIEDTGT